MNGNIADIDRMVHSDVSVPDNGRVADQSGDAGRRRRRYQVSDNPAVGESQEFGHLDRGDHADFLRVQRRRGYFAGTRVVQSIQSQLLQVYIRSCI